MQASRPAASQKNSPILVVLLAALGGCALACCGVGTLLLPPAIQATREAQRRQQTAKNLKQIGQALQNYHATHAVPLNEDNRELLAGLELPESPIEKSATEFKNNWLDEHPDEAIEFKEIPTIEKTASGWHAVFHAGPLPTEPEGEAPRSLHVYMDTDGGLIEVVLGSDEATRPGPERQ